MSKVTVERLDTIFIKTIDVLERKLDSGEATPQDLKTILKLIVDMGVEIKDDDSNSIVQNLLDSLPVDMDEMEFKEYIKG